MSANYRSLWQLQMDWSAGLLLLIWATVVNCQTCPSNVNDDIQRCVAPVAQFAEALGLDVIRHSKLGSDRLIPRMGAEVFKELCVRIATFTQCTRRAKAQCPSHITLALVNASYGYLCTEGYETFMKNADCLTKLDQDPTVRTCHDKTMDIIKNITGDSKSRMNHKLATMCDALYGFSMCVEKPILRDCGAAAWRVIDRVLRDTTRTLVPNCSFGPASATVPSTSRPDSTSRRHYTVGNSVAVSSTLKQENDGHEQTFDSSAVKATEDNKDNFSGGTYLVRSNHLFVVLMICAAFGRHQMVLVT